MAEKKSEGKSKSGGGFKPTVLLYWLFGGFVLFFFYQNMDRIFKSLPGKWRGDSSLTAKKDPLDVAIDEFRRHDTETYIPEREIREGYDRNREYIDRELDRTVDRSVDRQLDRAGDRIERGAEYLEDRQGRIEAQADLREYRGAYDRESADRYEQAYQDYQRYKDERGDSYEVRDQKRSPSRTFDDRSESRDANRGIYQGQSEDYKTDRKSREEFDRSFDAYNERRYEERSTYSNESVEREALPLREETRPSYEEETRRQRPGRNVNGGIFSKKPVKEELQILSWNLNELGSSKDDYEISFIANLLKDFDIVALQEVATSRYGPAAVAQLKNELSRDGERWDYVVSDPTSGVASERYAYLWKSQNVKMVNRAVLFDQLEKEIDREPFVARFEQRGKKGSDFLISNFHARPAGESPDYEIELLSYIHDFYPEDDVIFLGDFSLSWENRAFNQLSRFGYKPAIEIKSSLRKRASDGFLSKAFDNVFYRPKSFNLRHGGVVDFISEFDSLEEARRLSDHLPVWVSISKY